MPSSKEQYSNLRQVTSHITTNDADGIARFHASTPGEWVHYGPHMAVNTIYTTATSPPSFANNADISAHERDIASGSPALVNPNGTKCTIIEIGPGNVALMHRTQSLDYGVVLAGEIELTLDGGESRTMKAGDVVVQRATMHSWWNTSETEWVRMMFVLIESEKLVIGGKEMGQDLSAIQKASAASSGSKI